MFYYKHPVSVFCRNRCTIWIRNVEDKLTSFIFKTINQYFANLVIIVFKLNCLYVIFVIAICMQAYFLNGLWCNSCIVIENKIP